MFYFNTALDVLIQYSAGCIILIQRWMPYFNTVPDALFQYSARVLVIRLRFIVFSCCIGLGLVQRNKDCTQVKNYMIS